MVYKLQRGHELVIETATYKDQRGITQKSKFQELWFLYSACHLMLVNIYMKFHEDILNGLQDTKRTQASHRNCYYVQRGIIQKFKLQELWFL